MTSIFYLKAPDASDDHWDLKRFFFERQDSCQARLLPSPSNEPQPMWRDRATMVPSALDQPHVFSTPIIKLIGPALAPREGREKHRQWRDLFENSVPDLNAPGFSRSQSLDMPIKPSIGCKMSSWLLSNTRRSCLQAKWTKLELFPPEDWCRTYIKREKSSTPSLYNGSTGYGVIHGDVGLTLQH